MTLAALFLFQPKESKCEIRSPGQATVHHYLFYYCVKENRTLIEGKIMSDISKSSYTLGKLSAHTSSTWSLNNSS